MECHTESLMECHTESLMPLFHMCTVNKFWIWIRNWFARSDSGYVYTGDFAFVVNDARDMIHYLT